MGQEAAKCIPIALLDAGDARRLGRRFDFAGKEESEGIHKTKEIVRVVSCCASDHGLHAGVKGNFAATPPGRPSPPNGGVQSGGAVSF